MAVGTKDLAISQLEIMDDERLVDELRKSKEELFNLRFQAATGQLETHGRLKAVRRDISRIYTMLRERELGIRSEPATAVVKEVKPAGKKRRTAVKKKEEES